MRPVALALLSALLWGLWWIPVRGLEADGLPGLWAGVVMNSGALLALLIYAGVRRIPLSLSVREALGAALLGLAVTSFSTALNYSEVVRVILLFYLAPVWSKLIEWAFFGMRWTWLATLALVLAFLGALLILGVDGSLLALRPGDGLALFAGLAWSAGAALMFTRPKAEVVPLGIATSAAAVLAALVVLPFEGLPDAGIGAWGAGIGIGVAYALPIILMTLYAARKLPPATFSFLLTVEIVAGVVSAAILLDEPFGLRQVLGAALILGAAAVEVAQTLRQRDAASEGLPAGRTGARGGTGSGD